MWDALTELQSALSMPGKLEGRRHKASFFTIAIQFLRGLLAFVLQEGRLRIEGIHMGRASVEKEKDHPLGPGRKVSLEGKRWIGPQGRPPILLQNTRKPEKTSAASKAPEDLPPAES
tara:strand:+ start:1160 stop:1510 length:351 start_codon:yes stop_codon:yes gene_type:complete